MIARALRDELSFGAISRRELPVSSKIPYNRHVTPTILSTEDGMLLSILKLDGYAFETADVAEINAKIMARNDLIRTLGNSRFALYSHIIRREVSAEIPSTFDNEFCHEVDERYQASLKKRRMFVNEVYVTVVRRELQGNVGTFDVIAKRVLGKKTSDGMSYDKVRATAELSDVVTALRENLASYGARSLGVVQRGKTYFSEPLEFLLQLVNGAVPRQMFLPRMRLGEAMAMKRMFFGRNAIEFRGATPAETRYGAMLAIREYPPMTGAGLLNGLLRVPHEFIATQSFAIADKPEVMGDIERVSRQIDMSDEAESVVADAIEEARDELLSSEAIYGHHHFSVLCLGSDLEEVTQCVTAVGAALTNVSIIWIREDLNCEPLFWAQLPGNFSYIARKALISSKNMAGFASLHNYPSGKPDNNHWGPAISVLASSSQTAYYFNFHKRDLGNFTVIGPSGSGKTVFLAFIAAQAQRVSPRPKLVMIDKDRGLEIFVRALGGQYEVLRPGEPTGFNPLRLPNTGENREFLFQLICFMLRPANGDRLTAAEEQVIRNAIQAMMDAGDEGRTLPEFATLLRGKIRSSENDLYTRLQQWMRDDQRGWLFNNVEDRFNVSSIFGFDMTSVLDDEDTRTAALMYIFHRMKELLDGTPTMIFMDEGWRLLDDDTFAFFIKDLLKTIRKQNGIIGFGTQSAADIVKSKLSATLIEQTATNVFFPNPKADNESYQKAFRLSSREVEWIRNTAPEQRAFLVKHDHDAVIARLNLSAMPDLIKVLSGRTESVAELDDLRERVGDDPKVWLPIFLGRESE